MFKTKGTRATQLWGGQIRADVWNPRCVHERDMCEIPKIHCGRGIPPCDINNSTTVITTVFQSKSHFSVISLHHLNPLWSSHHILTPKDSWLTDYIMVLIIWISPKFPNVFSTNNLPTPLKTSTVWAASRRRFHGLGLNRRHVIASGSFRPGRKRTFPASSSRWLVVGWMVGVKVAMIHGIWKKNNMLGSSWEVPMSPNLLSHLQKILVGKGTPAKINISPVGRPVSFWNGLFSGFFFGGGIYWNSIRTVLSSTRISTNSLKRVGPCYPFKGTKCNPLEPDLSASYKKNQNSQKSKWLQ